MTRCRVPASNRQELPGHCSGCHGPVEDIVLQDGQAAQPRIARRRGGTGLADRPGDWRRSESCDRGIPDATRRRNPNRSRRMLCDPAHEDREITESVVRRAAGNTLPEGDTMECGSFLTLCFVEAWKSGSKLPHSTVNALHPRGKLHAAVGGVWRPSPIVATRNAGRAFLYRPALAFRGGRIRTIDQAIYRMKYPLMPLDTARMRDSAFSPAKASGLLGGLSFASARVEPT